MMAHGLYTKLYNEFDFIKNDCEFRCDDGWFPLVQQTMQRLKDSNFSGTILSLAQAKTKREVERIVGLISDIIAIDPVNATNAATINGKEEAATSATDP